MTKIQVNSQGRPYMTTNGKVLASNSGGGGSAVINELEISPTTHTQTINPQGNVDGYGPVIVYGVTSDIDYNIQPSNIRNGVEILGVTGEIDPLDSEEIVVTPTTSQQVITPTSPHTGITEVTVNAVTYSIDENIRARNIKNGVEILGVMGTYTGSGGGGDPTSAQEIMDASNSVSAILNSTEGQPIPSDEAVIAASILALNNIIGE